MRLLFVEDEPSSVEPIKLQLERDYPAKYECRIIDFDKAKEEIEIFQPDTVILDILAGGGTSDSQPEGNTTFDFIWKSRFCPVVVYSAHPDRLANGEWENHPFVKCIQKGKDSSSQLLSAIMEFEPHIIAIRETEQFIKGQFALALRFAAPYAFNAFNDTQPDQRKEAILCCCRRRIAALMDDQVSLGAKLTCWEQYLVPPISFDIKLGDILQLKDQPKNTPDSFRLVLTPSCDMVRASGKPSKVQSALVAYCCTNESGLGLCGLPNAKAVTLPDRLLSTGFKDGVLPLPSLKDRIPSMMANLKKLELVSLDDIGDETKKYVRIASLDSPFKELIAWAYMNTACRPGLPDRDLEAWAKEINPPTGADVE